MGGESAETERRLAELERLLAFIEDSGAVGVLQLDSRARIRRVNGAFVRRFGFEPDELISQPATMLLPDEDHALAERRFADAFAGTNGHDWRNWRVRSRDGSLHTVIIDSVAIDQAHPERGIDLIVTDVTEHEQRRYELARARDAAEIASRAKSAFLANVSHELRTPLNAILGFSEIMAYGLLGPINIPRYAEYVTDIHRSATHLLDIINALLDLAKIEAGRMELREQICDLRDIAQEVLSLLQPRIESAGTEVAITTQEDLTPLLGDKTKLRQMLVNLVANALKFTPVEGSVTIDLFRSGDQLGFAVVDSGIGMSEPEIDQALEPFRQVGDTLARPEGGTGLGLPLTRALAVAHGAELSIESSKGVGTRVQVLFPASRTLS
ncbi:MAG: sensory box protein [Rhodospirillales bacterium]|nr:sensory box protein [Rhodospirillales bacterium]